MTAVVDTIPDCLRAEVCPNCAYSLVGLPDPTRCPECGREIDPSEIILYGWARGQGETLATARKSRLWFVFLCSILGGSFWLLELSFSLHSIRFIAPLFAVLIAANLFPLFRRQSVSHPGMIQIRLSPRGCVQYDSLEGPGVLQELSYKYGWLALLAGCLVMIWFAYRGWMGSIAFWIWLPGGVAATLALWFRSRRFSADLAAVSPSAIADRNSAFKAFTPWSKIFAFYVNPSSARTYRFIVPRKHFVFTSYPIDADIRCTTEQANSLREWLKPMVRTQYNPAH